MIEHITFTDAEEPEAPPRKVLKIGLVKDMAFLTMEVPSEHFDSGEYKVMADGDAQIAINIYDLGDAILSLINSGRRDDEYHEGGILGN